MRNCIGNFWQISHLRPVSLKVFTGNIMTTVYDKAGLNRLDLTRAATVGCLVFSMFVPFTVMCATVTGIFRCRSGCDV